MHLVLVQNSGFGIRRAMERVSVIFATGKDIWVMIRKTQGCVAVDAEDQVDVARVVEPVMQIDEQFGVKARKQKKEKQMKVMNAIKITACSVLVIAVANTVVARPGPRGHGRPPVHCGHHHGGHGHHAGAAFAGGVAGGIIGGLAGALLAPPPPPPPPPVVVATPVPPPVVVAPQPVVVAPQPVVVAQPQVVVPTTTVVTPAPATTTVAPVAPITNTGIY